MKGLFRVKDGKTTEPITLRAGWAQKNQMLTWFSGKETVDSKGQIVKSFYFNKNGILRYEKERSVINPPTVLKEIANTKNGSTTLLNIFDEQPFDFPKPFELIQYLVKLITDSNSIILDSFSGSGTTAHAVLNLNKQDGGNRKFILVEMEDYAEAITSERIKRVIKGYADKEGTGGCFDFYELGQSMFLEDGNLNELLGEEKIRQYVYYTETQTPLLVHNHKDNIYFLDKFNDTAYYLHYEADGITTLDHHFLASMKTKAEQYVIYADNCLLTKEYMVKHHIVFKKIPRDVTKF